MQAPGELPAPSELRLLDPADALVRASLYPSGFAALGDTVLINGHIPDPGRTGFWMLAVPLDGPVVPAGVAEDRVHPDLRGYYRYRSVAASDSILLFGHRLQLEVEVLDRESLKPSRILSGTRPYFPPLDRDEYLAELANGQETFRTSGWEEGDFHRAPCVDWTEVELGVTGESHNLLSWGPCEGGGPHNHTSTI
jgi:hypothetical protein